jgi:type I restriction enzyme S subunit
MTKRLRHVVHLNPSKTEIGDVEPNLEVSFLPMEAIGEDGSIRLDATRPLSEVQSGYSYFRDDDVVVIGGI